jgi:hypothetical protein
MQLVLRERGIQAVREQQVSSHGFHGAKAARRRVLKARR